MKTLILYYSYSGNTRKIAQMIQKEIGGDMEEIKTVEPYVGDYNTVVDQGKHEVDSGYMPEIEPLSADPSDYDCVALGSPVWWYTFAPAIKTCLNKYSLDGKMIFPFATNGGWIGHIFKDIKKICGNADVRQGINIRFDGDRLVTEESDIVKWAQNIKNEMQED